MVVMVAMLVEELKGDAYAAAKIEGPEMVNSDLTRTWY